MCMVTDKREAMTKWKPKAYTYDYFFTIPWSVFISSSGRPFKGPLVDRSEVLWSTDQRLLGRPTRDPQNDVERKLNEIERKLNEKADFRTVLERDWTKLNEIERDRFSTRIFPLWYFYDNLYLWRSCFLTSSLRQPKSSPRFRYSLRYILRISWMIWTYLIHYFWYSCRYEPQKWLTLWANA